MSEDVQVGQQIRGTHPYCYKSGEWGLIVAASEINGRPCWSILWPDGSVDDWPVVDPTAEYEFQPHPAPPVTDTEVGRDA